MKTQNKLPHLLLATTITLVLSACDTKTAKIDNNSTSNDTNTTGSTETNTSTTTTRTLKSLVLSLNKTTLNKDANTSLNVVASYKDGTASSSVNHIEWIVTPSDAVTITHHTLIAKKDTNVTLRAKVGNTLSNKVNLSIYWEVNGHRLPPEPDPAVNNATLLGVDVNDNGVRDDVERWIYQNYKDKHPIYIDIAMQAGRAYKQVLETPERAKAIRESVNAPYFCGSYYSNYAKYFHEITLVHERIDTSVKSKYFNTKTRSDVYWEYDKLLSGDSYPLPKIRKMKKQCDFNTSKYDKK